MNDRCHAGKTIARLIHQSWRPALTSIEVDPERLAPLAEFLEKSGTAPLIWPLLKPVLAGDPRFFQLENSARLNLVWRDLQTDLVLNVSQRLDEAQIGHVLFKGLSAAQYYATPARRAVGDIDLLVSEKKKVQALEILAEYQTPGTSNKDNIDPISKPLERSYPEHIARFDVHTSLRKFGLDGSVILNAQKATKKVSKGFPPGLCPEDHVKLLIVHLLIHGAWRPVWFCDVCAALENHGEGLDIDQLLGKDRTVRTWMLEIIAFCCEQLGLEASDELSIEITRRDRISWLPREILSYWGHPMENHHPRARFTNLLGTSTIPKADDLRSAFRPPNAVRTAFAGKKVPKSRPDVIKRYLHGFRQMLSP